MKLYKTLTVKQPWAGLIASGVKTVENRTWRTTHRGPLLIHAGAALDSRHREIMTALPPALWWDHSLRRAVDCRREIVALVELLDVVDAATARELRPDQARWIDGPWCWLLGSVRRLSVPEVQGKLGLWTHPWFAWSGK